MDPTCPSCAPPSLLPRAARQPSPTDDPSSCLGAARLSQPGDAPLPVHSRLTSRRSQPVRCGSGCCSVEQDSLTRSMDMPRMLCNPFLCARGVRRGVEGVPMAGDDWVWPADNTGLEYYDLSIPWGHGVANWPYFEDVKIERVHYHAQVTGADPAHHDGHALDHPRRRAGARHRGHPVPRRDPAPLLLRPRRRGVDPQAEVGGRHPRRPGEGAAEDPARRHRHREHRLAPHLR